MATTTVSSQPFRFMDLSAELRNKVYNILLCSFQAAPLPPGIEGYNDRASLFNCVRAKTRSTRLYSARTAKSTTRPMTLW
jgi:hypothetical protein